MTQRGESPPLSIENRSPLRAYDEARLQYLSPSGLLARIQLYPYTPSYQEFFEGKELKYPEIQSHLTHLHYKEIEAMKAAGIQEDATIVSFACGDGSDALLWPAEYDHRGRVIGINLDPIFAYGMYHAEQLGYEPIDPAALHQTMTEINIERLKRGENPLDKPQISFLQKDAAETGLPDNSVDGTTINNLLHHADIEEIAAILREAIRITKYGGIIGMLGRGTGNMDEFWADVPRVIEALGAQKGPESFYRRFGIEDITRVIQEYFTPLSEYDDNQEEYMAIPGSPEGKRKYLDAFFALMPNIEYDPPKPPKESYFHDRKNPTRAEMAQALNQTVVPRIERQIIATQEIAPDGIGYIQDGVAQYLRVGVNDKWKTPEGDLLLP